MCHWSPLLSTLLAHRWLNLNIYIYTRYTIFL
jgi:hypothetical protein